MARMTGFSGGLSGKLGSVVFRQNHGETIASQYQPHVSNPNTQAQADQRAAFKLITQLAAEVAQSIAIARDGAVSSRNIFTKTNLPLVNVTETSAGAQAVIDLQDVQLTNSNIVNDVEFTVERAQTDLSVSILNTGGYDRIVFVAMATPHGTLAVSERPARLVGQVVYTPTDEPSQTVVIPNVSSLDASTDQTRYTVLAYGVSFVSGRAREQFDNAVGGNYQAGVNVSRSINFTDSRLTMTKGYNVPAE